MNLGRAAAFFATLLTATVASQAAPAPAPLVVAGLGRGSVVLDGPWEFHTGDDPAWAAPGFDDSNWERIQIDQPWGDQGHWAYSGFAWYRRRVSFEPSGSDSTNLGLYIPLASLQYELYWNGRLVGRSARLPATPAELFAQPGAFTIPAAENGVLAIRVWSPAPDTSMSGDNPAFSAAPRAVNVEALSLLRDVQLGQVLRRRLLTLIETMTYGQLFLLSLAVWWRSRSQSLLLWLSLYFFSAFCWTFFDPLFPPFLIFRNLGNYINSTFHTLEDISLWYLLLYLLNLDSSPALRRWTRMLAWIAFISALCDELIFHVRWPEPQVSFFQGLDVVFTAGFSLVTIYPLVLIYLGFRSSKDWSRRFVAIAAFLSEMYFVIEHTAVQGQRFTRWTLADTMGQTLFMVAGVEVHAQDLLSLLLVISIVYAVYRFTVEQAQQRQALQEEMRSAQELQRVLIPEALPALPGFAVTSAYRPAAEVGGDFFQLIPLEGDSALLVVGDVSGKGLKAAMAVTLIVGTLRTLAETTSHPAEILAGLNRRLVGRLRHGFVTCAVLRLDAAGDCLMASAGHPAPFLNGRELILPAALPLGLDPGASYDARSVHLNVDDRLTLYTDGLLEARNAAGELFGFERLERLIAARPDAAVAVEAAVAFGQEDDITVLTLTRLATGVESTTSLIAPELVSLTA
jgi:serine phosphatase RsbU (regulator of sigma subunit)